jgi:tetratricopeptide (TPR) repeat protein
MRFESWEFAMKSLHKAISGAAVAAMLVFCAGGAAAFTGGDTQPDSPLAKAGKALDAGDYAAAIPILRDVLAKEPRNADAHNYLGYASRKLGRVDEAKAHYLKALEIDPEHKGANEYLGELYLELDDLAGAEARLKVLDDACGFFGCEEFDELEEKIEAYKKGQQQS